MHSPPSYPTADSIPVFPRLATPLTICPPPAYAQFDPISSPALPHTQHLPSDVCINIKLGARSYEAESTVCDGEYGKTPCKVFAYIFFFLVIVVCSIIMVITGTHR